MSNFRGRGLKNFGGRAFQGGRRSRGTYNGRPAGLRGKEIGLYYKNKGKMDRVINLKIPTQILSAVNDNLKLIESIANKENISLELLKNTLFEDFKRPRIETVKHRKIHCDDMILDKRRKDTDLVFKNNTQGDMSVETVNSDDSDEDFDIKEFNKLDEGNIKLNNEMKIIEEDIIAGSSSMPDFIPIYDSPSTEDHYIREKLLSLREERHFKYGYYDIITGTFQDKLDENLSNGIQITCTNAEISRLNNELYEEHTEMLEKPVYRKMLEFRKILPAFKKQEDILDVIDRNQVIVISGETGCGKSTQIPQLILDKAMRNKKGANVRILVTQPRRIAASSLAIRVANERAENLGKSVGYSVRLETVETRPRGSIMYCTTGVLLVELEVNQALSNFSHIILDEVHERDTHVDLAMCMLKQILKKRKDLKLILMSATLDADVLSMYFDDCPTLQIEGLAYPVKDIYLEDILTLTNYRLQTRKEKKQPIWMKYRDKGRRFMEDEMVRDIRYKAEIAPWLESIKKKIPFEVYKTLQDSRIEDLNIDLIVYLLIYICKGDPGAILVFLPGIGDITKLIRLMEESGQFNKNTCEIYPLHSKLATLEQHRIFERPRDGVRKIILATNIAETSITIDDIVYVIDCGKIKINGLNVEENISTLNVEWVSKANLHQRRGRAGRCQPGICYHLVTSYRAQTLADRLLPELQRSNLLEPVLTVKKLRLGLALEAFQMVPSPPAEKTVNWAVRHLQKCGALDEKETLTPLGWHLARLPVHPAAGKLLLLGSLFGCLDRAASVAAVWSFKDPFQLVIGKESETKAVKRTLAMGEPSDHVAISEAVMQWENCSKREQRSFAYENYLSNNTLELLVDMKKQLGHNLKQMGFLSSGDVQSHWENRNWNNLSLFKAIVAASLYPNIGQVHWRNLRSFKKPPSMVAFCPEDGKVKIHPSSVMATSSGRKPNPNDLLCTSPGANWLVYWLKQKSSDLFVIDVTLVYTLPLLFFGEFMVNDDPENPDNCIMSMGKDINVRCNKISANSILKLRFLLDHVLANKVMVTSTHSVKHSQFEEEVLNTVIQLITAEDEQTEYIDDDLSEASDDNAFR
ncbi:unnamed protein product [Leptosia nina]|uniref:RNA helicase n=1 Tax=Leptosia nina TaxID=320188 RepID=A0AAV1K5E3_9NEOP